MYERKLNEPLRIDDVFIHCNLQSPECMEQGSKPDGSTGYITEQR